MKKFFWTVLFFGIAWNCLGQKQYLRLKMISQPENQQKIIDSIGYQELHENKTSLIAEINRFNQKISAAGYIEAQTQNQPTDDSTYVCVVRPGIQIKNAYIYIGIDSVLRKLGLYTDKSDTLKMRYPQTEGFLEQTLRNLEQKGWALSEVRLTNIKKTNQDLFAALEVKTETERHFDDLLIKGDVRFPKSHLKQLKRVYRKKKFTQENLKKLALEIDKFRFVAQTKYPEILFKSDSTKVYCYLEKAKSNNFEGFVGFTNSQTRKLTINGYLDLNLSNLLRSGESFTLYWKSDGNDQKTFNTSLQLPYIFESPLGIKAQLNIFKQDSTFQNTKTNMDLGYLFNYNTRLYLGYQSTESSDIQNQNTTLLNDFSNHFTTAEFEFTDWRPEQPLFAEKTKINAKMGNGNRTSKNQRDTQFFGQLNLKHIIYLNSKNNICIRSENFYLNSNQYITNELYRFGGINSVRGFNENSLQANLLGSILTEYRWVPASNFYLYTIVDYGYYQDKTINKSGNLLGLGLGLGVVSKNGLINLIYANGSTETRQIKGSNSIVHLSFKTVF